MPTVPTCPRYPAADAKRAERQRVAFAILSEDCEDDALTYLQARFGEAKDILDHWGVPDTSVLPLASSTRQLVTPGLYGRPPILTLPEGDPAARLAGPGGLLDRSGYWARSQHVQYLAYGIGLAFRRQAIAASGEGATRQLRLTDRVVPPHLVIVDPDPEDPTRMLELAELQIRKVGGAEVYVWDVWSIADPAKPFRRVHLAVAGEPPTKGKDVSRQVLVSRDPAVPSGAQEGENYRYRDPDGRPFLPWTAPRVVDDGAFFPRWRLGMLRGTFEVVGYQTQVGYVARFATGNHVILAGADMDSLGGTQTVRADERGAVIVAGSENAVDARPAVPTATVRIMPGTMRGVRAAGAQTISVHEIGPGASLTDLAQWLNQSQMQLYVADGLNPTDATRQSANPTSGAALEISARSKRELAQQVEPWFRAADLEAIQHYAWLLTMVGEPTPGDGYGITYQTVPLTPNEQADLREDLDWELKHGQISEIDVYQRRHPGSDATAATRALSQARADALELDRSARELLAEKGLEETAGTRSELLDTVGGMSGYVSIAQAVGEGKVSIEAGAMALATFLQIGQDLARSMLERDPTAAPAGSPPAPDTEATDEGGNDAHHM